jgi:Mor family transcriptional regulator
MLQIATHEAGRMSGGWPESLIDITEVVTEEFGDPSIALRLVRCLSRHFGGEQIYIPSPDTVDRPARDTEIRRLYDGTPDGRHGIHALAIRYGISHSTVRRIVHNS